MKEKVILAAAIDLQRRSVLRLSGALALAVAAGLLRPDEALAQQQEWNQAAFGARQLAPALQALGAAGSGVSADILLDVPDLVENGAFVPVSVSTTLAKVQQIALLVEHNPNPLAALFTFAAGTEPQLATRIKMAQSAAVYALVQADGQWRQARKAVTVIVGGCAS
jgi:sulfur-oxidizing protein SoxY